MAVASTLTSIGARLRRLAGRSAAALLPQPRLAQAPAPAPDIVQPEPDLLAGEIQLHGRSMPLPLFFAVGNICTANCVFCGYQNNIDPKKMMPFETFKDGLDQFVALGGEYIDFTTPSGDPLVDMDLPRKIAYARSVGIKRISLATNGILLGYRDQYKALIDHNVEWVVLSTPGFDREAYRRIYRVDKYDEVIDGIRKLAAYKQERGATSDLAISMRLDRPLEAALSEPDYVNLIKPWVDAGMLRVEYTDCSTTVHNWSGQITQEALPDGMHLLTELPAKRIGYTCSAMQHGAAVLPNGDVRVCNCRYYKTERDELVVGNIHEQPLKAILYSDRVKDLVDQTTRGNWPRTCQDCSFYQESPTCRA
jgi:radical SAM protein with 4Fe4S-binding SPASM domain